MFGLVFFFVFKTLVNKLSSPESLEVLHDVRTHVGRSIRKERMMISDEQHTFHDISKFLYDSEAFYISFTTWFGFLCVQVSCEKVKRDKEILKTLQLYPESFEVLATG